MADTRTPDARTVEELVEMQDELAVMAADFATAAGDVATPDDWKAEAYRRLYIDKAAEEATRE